MTFLVTRIGCGIAGFRDDEIAPLFKDAIDVENIILPQEFAKLLNDGTKEDSFCLERFVKAQEQMYAVALKEIEQGQNGHTGMVYIPTTGSSGTQP